MKLTYELQRVQMFIAGDQLLKGAAQNAVQIAEVLIADAQ